MEQLNREDVKSRLINIFLQANTQCVDELTVTSVAERYFANLNIGDCPIANAYVHILKSKIHNYSDSGLFLVGMSASLQLEIQEGSLAQIHHRLISQGLQLALEWTVQYLESPRCPVRVAVSWRSSILITAVIRSIIASKSTTSIDIENMNVVVAPLIIRAFVSVFEYVIEHPGENVPVQLLYTPGLESIAESEVWKQTVFLDVPWPDRGICQSTKRSPAISNVRVALFNITIEPLIESNVNDCFSNTSITHKGSLDAFRLKALRKVGDQLEQLGATAVFSQKIIPSYLQTYLAAKGIFTLSQLSAAHILGVQMLSGATILSDWNIDESVRRDSLGFLTLITTHTLGKKQYIRLHREGCASQTIDSKKAHAVTTITVAAPDQIAYDELSHVMNVSLSILAKLIENPDVVAGGGCFEIHLAALLRHRASQLVPVSVSDTGSFTSTQIQKQTARTLSQLRQIVTVFAACLEDMAGRLCGSQASYVDRVATIDQVRNANCESLMATKAILDENVLTKSNAFKLYGWDTKRHSVIKVLAYDDRNDNHGCDQKKVINDALVVDVLQSKKNALVLAIESVSSLARIASVVRAS
ncbi:Chaperonin complex component, TCP-1 alpha subunit (CCT1) [Plasmopara halstedii]|uniref:Chaperonin complex component, TCP-1 alpha subunit (CCT1) n=1 Tax=Plasmopara halstedii TaxID=4781 RepID=A0A0P1AEU9_PLAHL|nr:Chaperonin complex component, TCP-1 alpha subunit (CCT1) [Plasmopara halstedii]CEG39102.1 Chaperonin complex component, TCP-1 alpha subunit (CCT1) [Plasmopara halstedii]|eukprot:XP_024575471.1 Chaperonin complex component, TCP-1 alpha subunit (CCT1) [Plasmopara halstedii]